MKFSALVAVAFAHKNPSKMAMVEILGGKKKELAQVEEKQFPKQKMYAQLKELTGHDDFSNEEIFEWFDRDDSGTIDI